jgi:lipid-binding SYLF domain-containing protein
MVSRAAGGTVAEAHFIYRGIFMVSMRSVLLFVITSLALGAVSAQDGNPSGEMRRQEIDLNARQTLDELLGDPRGDAQSLFDKAAGYAVFSATKAGFVVTGGRGTGVAINKASGARTYRRMLTGGIGLGIGAQNYDLIIFFETAAQLDRFVQGRWDASTQAQAAAGTEGITFASSFNDGVALFQITERGLMAQADVSGTRFRVLNDLN